MEDNINILVLEDSTDDYELSLNTLRKAEYHFNSKIVWNQVDFEMALSEKNWDIILCDYDMPQFNALDAIRILKESGKDIPLIVISGSISEEIAVNAIKAGANDYLMKDKLVKLPYAVARELREAKIRREKKAQDEALAVAYSELKGLMDAVNQSAMLIISDVNGQIKSANKNFCNLSGYSREEITSHHISQFTVDKNDQNYWNEIITAIAEKSFWRGVWKNYNKSGKLYWIETVISPLLINDHDIDGYMFLSYDISEIRKAAIERQNLINELLKNNQDLEQFNYIISHNLRSPVAKLVNLTEIYGFDDIDKETRETLVGEIKNEALALDEILTDLGTITAIRNSQTNYLIDINLEDELQLALKLLTNDLKLIPHKINVDFSKAQKISGIKSYVQSIFYNLLSNALKYREPLRELKIDINSEVRQNNKVLITFSDNGTGLDLKKNKAKIFGLYKRFHFNTQGKGIGLYITKTQVERMGGEININSNPGGGISLEIVLPATKETQL